MPNNNYDLADAKVKHKIKNMLAIDPKQWVLKADELKLMATHIIEHCHQRRNVNNAKALKPEYVLLAGMLLQHCETMEPKLFLSWLCNDSKHQDMINCLKSLHQIVLNGELGDENFKNKTNKDIIFYIEPAQIYNKNRQYVSNGYTLTKLLKILDGRDYSQEDLNVYAPFIIKCMRHIGVENLKTIPKNLHWFLAAYLNNLANKDKIAPANVLLAGVLLRTPDQNGKYVAYAARNNLIELVLQKNVSLLDILSNENASGLFSNLAVTLIANIKYMIEDVVVDKNGNFINQIYTKQLQNLLVKFSHDTKNTYELAVFKEMLNFLLNIELSKSLAPEYTNLWLSLIVSLANAVYVGTAVSNDFTEWLDCYIKKDANIASAVHLLQEINKAKSLKDGFFETLRENIKQHLQVYPEGVITFLHQNKLLNKPGTDMDLYFKELVLREHDVHKKNVNKYVVKHDGDRKDMIHLMTKIIGKSNTTDAVLRFNIAAIIRYANPKFHGYYTFGNLYFSIKSNNGLITMYSPNLQTAPEVVQGALVWQRLELFLHKICTSVAKEKIQIVELQLTQYELELEARSRSTTPLTFYSYREANDGAVKLVRSKSTSNFLQHKAALT